MNEYEVRLRKLREQREVRGGETAELTAEERDDLRKLLAELRDSKKCLIKKLEWQEGTMLTLSRDMLNHREEWVADLKGKDIRELQKRFEQAKSGGKAI